MTNGSSVDSAYFQRQMRLPGVGVAGQQRLARAHVAVVGLGALGSPVVTYLARAGVGRLTLWDGDEVAYHNLHRQPLYSRRDVGRPKATVAAELLARDFPDTRVDSRCEYVGAPVHSGSATTGNLDHDDAAFADADVVLDCTDRFSSRFAVHDAARRNVTDLVSGAVGGFSGQLQLFRFSQAVSPCLRCLYPTAPPDGCTGSCAEDGILGAAASIVASWQALTALRVLLELPTVAPATTHSVDLVTLEVFAAGWDTDATCPLCGSGADTGKMPVLSAPPAGVTGIVAVDTGDEAGADEGDGVATLSAAADVRIIDVRAPEEEQPIDRILLPSAERVPLEQLLNAIDALESRESGATDEASGRRESRHPSATGEDAAQPEEFAEPPPISDRDGAYLLVCETGARSLVARDAMRAAGFHCAMHVAGGFAGLRTTIE